MEDGNILTLDKDKILDQSEEIWKALCLR